MALGPTMSEVIEITHRARVHLFDEPYQQLQETIDECGRYPFLNF
jgi:hypothetical protein